jgi:adenylate cyclase
MPLEIERKFLVKGPFKEKAVGATDIVQGYLCVDPSHSVRVRIYDEKGLLTIKGRGDSTGRSRYEWEKEIPTDEARELMSLCLHLLVKKTRYLVPYGSHTYEVDVFHGENEGLIIAEIELASPGEEFEKPEWLGKEVTGDPAYYNASLSLRPYGKW